MIINKEKIKRIRKSETAHHRVKPHKKKKPEKNTYLGLARKLRKQLHMRLTATPIVIGAHKEVSKGSERELELEIGVRIVTIKIKASLRSARIQRRVLDT